jgi:hypothetical protein
LVKRSAHSRFRAWPSHHERAIVSVVILKIRLKRRTKGVKEEEEKNEMK